MHTEIVKRLRSALAAADFRLLEPVLAKRVRFGSCLGAPQVLQHLQHLARGNPVKPVRIEALEDRVIATLVPDAGAPHDTPGGPAGVAVLFVRDGRIDELQYVAGREQALGTTATASPPPWTGVPTRMTRLAAVLPVRDLGRALEHYRALGFAVSAYSGGGYGYGERDGLNVHFAVVPELDPGLTTSAVYLYVEDADALYAEWRSSGASGQFFEPGDTEYGLREGAHADLDGNLLRFGCPSKQKL